MAKRFPHFDRNLGIFWYWNSDLTKEIITRQLQQIRDAGFRSVCIHPMPDSFRKNDFLAGMKIPYPGKRYFSLIRFAVYECKRLNLFVTLYDEGGWPSGTACGKIVEGNPEFAAMVLVKNADGTIAPRRFSENGWQTDMMNPKVTEKFISLVHERYFESAGEEFGNTIRGIFTDEAKISGLIGSEKNPWSPLLPEAFKQENGFDVETIYPHLFPDADLNEETLRARELYRNCCTELMARNFYALIAKWCHKHNIEYEGHLGGEDSLSKHAACFGNFMTAISNFDTPGVDAIWRQIHPSTDEGAFVKLAQSAAIRYGRHETMSESFNVYGSGETTSNMNWIANAQFIHGINRMTVMPFLSSADGVRKISCGTDFSPRIPIWRLFPALTAHWEWVGAFDPGAIEAPVHVKYAPEIQRDEKEWLKLFRHLDDNWIFWRFAEADEAPKQGTVIINDSADLSKLTNHAVIKPLNPQGTFRVLPCRRTDGTDALMVFCKDSSGGIFRFASDEEWTELPPPDSLPSVIEPLRRIPGGYETRFAPGELRIFHRAQFLEPQKFISEQTHINWNIDYVERWHIGERITHKKLQINKSLPDSGNYTEKESGFSGVLNLSAEIVCGKNIPRYIRFRELWSGGILSVNGVRTGMRAFAPWVFPLTNLHYGKNIIKLEVIGSLENEWLRAYKTEWKPQGICNSYCDRIAGFSANETRCGVVPEAELVYIIP